MMNILNIVLVGAFIVFGPAVVLGIVLGLKYDPFVGAISALILFIVSVRVCQMVVSKRMKVAGGTEDIPTYTCPEDCQFFREGKCSLGSQGGHISFMMTHEREGGYDICPFYMKPLLERKGGDDGN